MSPEVFKLSPAMSRYLEAFDRFLRAPTHMHAASARLDMTRSLTHMHADAAKRDMTLQVIPDVYRLNAAQRDQLLNLYEGGLLKSPVTVAKPRASGRVAVRDADGNRWLIHRNGWADLIPDR